MPRTVLIIDDDADTLTYMSTILLRGGFLVITAKDGQEGFQKVADHRPDAVLLDIMMPRQSGIHLLQQLKTHPEHRVIPVILVTGVGQMTGVDIRKHMRDEAGQDAIRPDGFLEKPVKPHHLLQIIQDMLPE